MDTGHSNEQWGDLDPVAQARWDAWDLLAHLPEDDTLLNVWLARKNLTRADLVRTGTRWSDNRELVTFYPDGLKYRSIVTNHRHNEVGAQFDRCKVVSAIVRPPVGCIVAEGETDGALLARIAPTFDVAILPAGAKHVTPVMIEQLRRYPVVLAAHDDDEAGNEGAAKLLELRPDVRRLKAPPNQDNDWCGATIPEDWDALTEAEEPPRLPVYTLGEIMAADFGSFEDNNWFAQGILPIGGQMVMHAKRKSLKSVVLLELLRAIATGTPFAGGYDFVRPDGPGRVLLFQFEILPFYFQARVTSWLKDMTLPEREAMMSNFATYHIGDALLPRLKVDTNFLPYVRQLAEAHRADVVAFDPIQRMTGGASQDRANEMDPLLDAYGQLQADGYTVIYCHHNNKAHGKGAADPDAMTGTQRFSGDADSILSLWHGKGCVADDNPHRVKQRNWTFTLRNGAANGRSVSVEPDPENDLLMRVKFDAMIAEEGEDDDSFPALT